MGNPDIRLCEHKNTDSLIIFNCIYNTMGLGHKCSPHYLPGTGKTVIKNTDQHSYMGSTLPPLLVLYTKYIKVLLM